MNEAIPKLLCHIPGLDYLTDGGLPEGRATLVAGTAGSAKTVLAGQFLAAGIQHGGDSGVFVTFEESVSDLRRNMKGLGWDIPAWEAEGRWAFVDVSPDLAEPPSVIGSFDLLPLLARIESAVKKTGARRVAMDALGSMFDRFKDAERVRGELLRIVAAIKSMGLTLVVTTERTEEFGSISRFGVEEFVADNVIVLRNVLCEEKRRRTIEVLKLRGGPHRKGEYPFSVLPGKGIVVVPLSSLELKQGSSTRRISSGSPDLDRMCGGGIFRDSVILISGATGTGKTLLATEFMAGGVKEGERCLMLAFEESHQQLLRNATSWGVDYAQMEAEGLLKIICRYPETDTIEDHLIRIKEEIESFKPDRLAVDSLSALERVSTERAFREFAVSLTSFIKSNQVAGLLTATTSTLMGGSSVTEAHVSTITDTIVLLRYVETGGLMRRGVTVLKMRGSAHDRAIREFHIDGEGMHIGEPFDRITGILGGYIRRDGLDDPTP